MGFSDKLKNHKNNYTYQKSYRDAIETLKQKYPSVRLNTYKRKFTIPEESFFKFVDDLNCEYSLCGVKGYEGVDKYYWARETFNMCASVYSSIFKEAEKDEDEAEKYLEELREEQEGKKKFKVNKEFLDRFDPMVTIFYLKLRNKKN